MKIASVLTDRERAWTATAVETPPMVGCNLGAAEQRVLNLVSQAKTNKEIAAALHISPATVKRHLEDILRKLQLKNRVAAAIYGLMMRACASELDSQCPFALWRQTALNDGRRFGRGNKDSAAALRFISMNHSLPRRGEGKAPEDASL